MKILPIICSVVLAQVTHLGEPSKPMAEPAKPSIRGEVLEESIVSTEPIKWIDPAILKKLQEIKPAAYEGYVFSEVLALFPKTETVRSFLGGARVDRVYLSTASKMMEDIYGKGASLTGLDPRKPVYVFEGTHTRPIPVPSSPRERGEVRMSNAKVTVVSDVQGRVMFTDTAFP